MNSKKMNITEDLFVQRLKVRNWKKTHGTNLNTPKIKRRWIDNKENNNDDDDYSISNRTKNSSLYNNTDPMTEKASNCSSLLNRNNNSVDANPFVNKSTMELVLSKKKDHVRVQKQPFYVKPPAPCASIIDNNHQRSSPRESLMLASRYKATDKDTSRASSSRDSALPDSSERSCLGANNRFSTAEESRLISSDSMVVGESRGDRYVSSLPVFGKTVNDVINSNKDDSFTEHLDLLPAKRTYYATTMTNSRLDLLPEIGERGNRHSYDCGEKRREFMNGMLLDQKYQQQQQYQKCCVDEGVKIQEADSPMSTPSLNQNAASQLPSNNDLAICSPTSSCSSMDISSIGSDNDRLSQIVHTSKVSQQLCDDDFDSERETLPKGVPDQFFDRLVFKAFEPEIALAEPKSQGKKPVPLATAVHSSSVSGDYSEHTSSLSADIKALEEEIESLDFRESVLKEVEAYCSLAEDNVLRTPKRHNKGVRIEVCDPAHQSHDGKMMGNAGTRDTKLDGTPKSPPRSRASLAYASSMTPSKLTKLQNRNIGSSANTQIEATKRYQSNDDLKQANVSFGADRFSENQFTPRIKPPRRSPPCRKIARKCADEPITVASESPTISNDDSAISEITADSPTSCADVSQGITIAIGKIREQAQKHWDRHPKSASELSDKQQLQCFENKKNYTRGKYEKEIPEEVENFLYDALGTYHNASINTNISPSINTNPSPVSDCSTCNQDSNKRRSGTFNNLKTLSQKIQKKFRKSGKSDESANTLTTQIELIKVSPNLRSKVQALREQIEIQQTLIYQASKALSLCCLMPEFTASQERVESERALLLAKLRHRAFFDEIIHLTSSECNDEIKQQYTARSDFEFGDVRLRSRDNVTRCERHIGDSAEWFLIVIHEGQRVWASHPVLFSQSLPSIQFPDAFLVDELNPNFKIIVRVFGLELRHEVNYDHSERYHLRGNQNFRPNCPSPNLMLRNSIRWKSRRPSISSAEVNITATTKNESNFAECGRLELTLRDILTSKGSWNLTAVPADSPLHGTIEMKGELKLKLTTPIDGFVNLGEELNGRIYWTRLYCVFEEHFLYFWKYPHSRDNGVPPERTIDISRCTTRRVELADRSLCAKPKTLLIATSRERRSHDRDTALMQCRRNITIVGDLLSFDDNIVLEEWQNKLNYVLSVLREWMSVVEVQ